jgi:hypothetical protein
MVDGLRDQPDVRGVKADEHVAEIDRDPFSEAGSNPQHLTFSARAWQSAAVERG